MNEKYILKIKREKNAPDPAGELTAFPHTLYQE